MTAAVAATIAGSDSGGGAGIQADLATFGACGVFGASAVTAVTAQDTVRVHAVEYPPLSMVAGQIDAIAGDLQPRAWKTGMLGTAAIVAVVAQRLEHHGVERLVVDPVMVAKGGDRLLDDGAVQALLHALLPLALVVTPNLPETRVLLGMAPDAAVDAEAAAWALCRLGPRVAVVKGGHAPGGLVVDVVVDAERDEVLVLRNPRVEGPAPHGTGCTLSAAITAFLARGLDPLDAVASARAYLQVTLGRLPGVGAGHGPVGHHDLAAAAPVVRAERAAARPG